MYTGGHIHAYKLGFLFSYFLGICSQYLYSIMYGLLIIRNNLIFIVMFSSSLRACGVLCASRVGT